MRPTMFVVMVEMPTEINLRNLYFELIHEYSVKALAPGSLGQRVVNVHEWVIGSIEAKVLDTSVLVFPNGKIKVSGGSTGYNKDSGAYENWLETHKVLPVLRVLFPGAEQSVSLKISLINGSHTLPEVNMLNFFDICNLLEDEKNFIVSKPSMLVNPGKRGRICSVSVKTHKTKGSLRFDHSGKLQLFGFKSYSDMEMMLGNLETHLKKTTMIE